MFFIGAKIFVSVSILVQILFYLRVTFSILLKVVVIFFGTEYVIPVENFYLLVAILIVANPPTFHVRRMFNGTTNNY